MKKIIFPLRSVRLCAINCGIMFFLTFSLAAADFGLLLEQSTGAQGTDEASGSFETGFIPRFTSLLGDSSNQSYGELIVTGGLTLGYNDDWYCIPEILRSEFMWRFNNMKITAGRMEYSAPLACVAGGFFDGFVLLYDSLMGTFSAGAWYTGLLYKKKANITITEEDSLSYHTKVDGGNLYDTYFASRRIVTALGWEHLSFADAVRTKIAVISQTDVNRRDDYFHSQYFTAKIGIPVQSFLFDAGGVFELAQNPDSSSNIGLAGELAAYWMLPTAFPSRLAFSGYFSSGTAKSGHMIAFVPVTSQPCGAVLEAEPSGISALSLDYTARLHKTFSSGFTSTYFIRSDLATYTGYPVNGESDKGYLLGNEFFMRLIWSPFSDVQINLGSGFFLPSMGNVASDMKPQWSVKLTAILAAY